MDLTQKIVDVTKEIFETMLMREVTPGQPVTAHVSNFKHSLSALIGFAGFRQGALAIHLPDNVATGLTSDFLGMEVTEINEDVEDAMGELANMIAGSLKSSIANGGQVELSLPSVVYGKEYTMTVVAQARWLVVPFTVSRGRFLVSLYYMDQH